MTRRLITFGLMTVLCLLMSLMNGVSAQSPGAGERSPSPAPSLSATQLCISIVGEAPPGGWDAASLARAIAAGTATITEVANPGTCLPSATPGAEATEVATPAETVAAPTETPVPTSSAAKGGLYLRTVKDSVGYIHAQVILEVVNNGTTWIELTPYDSDYTIYAKNGDITTTDSFDQAWPDMLGPGQTGYLVGEESGQAQLDDYSRVEADAYFQDGIEPAVVPTFNSTKVSRAQFGGVRVVGKVHNPGSDRYDNLEVGAIFLNKNGEPAGSGYTYVDHLEANRDAAFELEAEVPDSTSSIAKTLYFANL